MAHRQVQKLAHYPDHVWRWYVQSFFLLLPYWLTASRRPEILCLDTMWAPSLDEYYWTLTKVTVSIIDSELGITHLCTRTWPRTVFIQFNWYFWSLYWNWSSARMYTSPIRAVHIGKYVDVSTVLKSPSIAYFVHASSCTYDMSTNRQDQ